MSFVTEYNLSELLGLTNGLISVSVTKIKTFIDENFSDIVETQLNGNLGNAAFTENSDRATLKVFLKNTDKTIGLAIGNCNISTTASAVNIGNTYMSGLYTSMGTISADTVDSNVISVLTKSDFANNIRLKYVKSKYGFIFDIYAVGHTKDSCRMAVLDINGEKVSFMFYNNLVYYYRNELSGSRQLAGGLLNTSAATNKRMEQLYLPWMSEPCEHIYLTDGTIVGDNKEYIFSVDNKSYVDITGGSSIRGFAVELEEDTPTS